MPSSRISAAGRRRADLILFFTLAFGVSWACWGAAIALGGPAAPGTAAYTPYLVGAFGPLVSALVIRIRRGRRREPVPAHAVRFRPAALLWAPLLMAAAAGAVLAAAAIGQAAGDPAISGAAVQHVIAGMGGPAAFLVSMIVSGPLSEEPGWRGTAYPRMRATAGRFPVALALGIAWAVWHLPLFFIDGTVQHGLGLATPGGVLFAAGNIPMAMLVTCAYERAGVLASIAVHFAVNTTMVLLNVQTPATQALIMGMQALLIAVLLLARGKAPAAAAAGALRGGVAVSSREPA